MVFAGDGRSCESAHAPPKTSLRHAIHTWLQVESCSDRACIPPAAKGIIRLDCGGGREHLPTLNGTPDGMFWRVSKKERGVLYNIPVTVGA